MPVTDAMQRVFPVLDEDETRFDHAQISFVAGIQERNKRLVVHHYASRSFEDYQTKLSRGAGDHTRSSHLRGMGFFDALNACALCFYCMLLYCFAADESFNCRRSCVVSSFAVHIVQ